MRGAAVSLLLLTLSAPSAAQDTLRAPVVENATACDGKRITTIEVRRPDRTAVDEVQPAIIRPVLRAVLQTAPTLPGALRPWVMLREGEICSEVHRRESERLLRDLPYVADATLTAEPDGDGVRLILVATDELKPVLGLKLDGTTPSYVRFGSASVAGSGVFVVGDWNDGGAYRDGFALRATDWTTAGRRAIASMVAARYPLGHLTQASIREPFFSRLQSIAWEASFRDEAEFVRLERNTSEPVAWRTTWRTSNAGLLGRIHLGPAQLLAGGLFTHERIVPAESAVVIGASGLRAPVTALTGRYASQTGTRAGIVGGLRTLSFRRAEGLEALEGAHDLARGAQVAFALGRGVAGDDDEPFVAGEFYSGVGGDRSFASVRGTLEHRGEDVGGPLRLISGHGLWLWRVSPRQTQEVSLEYTGIWREDVPIALFLDDRRAGPRGFEGATAAGSRLFVARLERRLRVGGFGRAVGLGLAGFVDGAKLWEGDSPLGTTTGPHFGVGTGFLLAIPRDSRRTIRIDAAYPMTSADGASSLNVRLAVTNAGRTYWREPAAFFRSRIAPSLRTLVGWF